MDSYSQVISLDPEKIYSKTIDDKTIVYKKTSNEEKDNLIKAQAFLREKSIKIKDTNYSIHVPDVYSWNQDTNTLSMSYCPGENLELLLRNPDTRNDSIPFLQSMLKFILEHHFYWQDFAPRNIIIDNTNIYLVDFEKGLDFSVDNLQVFLRNHVFEEYSSFLLPDERLISAERVFAASTEEKNKQIKIDDIKVKRIKSIAIALGHNKYISMEEYLKIQTMIIKAEEPFQCGNSLVFPRIALVEMLENKDKDSSVYDKYANKILSINNLVPQNLNKERKGEERD